MQMPERPQIPDLGMLSLPTRLSVDSDVKEYCDQFDVFFNGERQTQCTVADAAQGYIIRYKLNLLGLPIKSNIGKNRFKTEKLEGLVEIKLKETPNE